MKQFAKTMSEFRELSAERPEKSPKKKTKKVIVQTLKPGPKYENKLAKMLQKGPVLQHRRGRSPPKKVETKTPRKKQATPAVENFEPSPALTNLIVIQD